MDARYVIEQLMGWIERGGPTRRMKGWTVPLCQRAAELVADRDVQFTWIPRDEMEGYLGC